MARAGIFRSLSVVLLGLGLLLPSVPVLASIESEIAFHRGVEAYGKGDLEAAKAEFQKVLAEVPDDAAAIRYLGLIAQAQEDTQAAVDHHRRAAALLPDDLDVRMDLAVALLEAGEPAAALETCQAVLAKDPDRADAHLFTGIAHYRLSDYGAATPELEKAVQLDPALELEANYYLGLSQAYLGDFAAAAGALARVENRSPAHPLGQSAGELREKMAPALPERRWALRLTAGGEFDSNPRVIGQTFIDRDDDFRGVFRVRGSYRLLGEEHYSFAVGYDGYLSLHTDETDVDLQTHVGWTQGSLQLAPFRFGLRYDFGFTQLDLDEDYQRLHRITPAIYLNEGSWGVSEAFYQYSGGAYFYDTIVEDPGNPNALDQDGRRDVIGFNQFLFPGGPVQYLRFGGLYDTLDPDGTEYEYEGWEASFGVGFALPWKLTLTTEYSYARRDYENESVFEPGRKRHNIINRVSAELVRPVGKRLEVSLYGYFRNNDSNIATYDYDRVIVGTYLTYVF